MKHRVITDSTFGIVLTLGVGPEALEAHISWSSGSCFVDAKNLSNGCWLSRGGNPPPISVVCRATMLAVCENTRTPTFMPSTADCPAWAREALDRYRSDGIPTGDFLRAVLANDLMGAARCADDESAGALEKIVRYVYWHVPAGARGSYEVVDAWIEEYATRRSKAVQP